MKIIYMILNHQNGYKYIGVSDILLNKKWREILANKCNVNDTLHRTLCNGNIADFKMTELEEIYQEHKLETRLQYWLDKYKPEYNKVVHEWETKEYKEGKYRKNWHKGNKGKSRASVILKAKHKESGKWMQVSGWKRAAAKVNGDWRNIMRAASTNNGGGYAYGYYWYIKKPSGDTRRRCYGVDGNGAYTKTFDSLTEAMRALGGDDNCKGICTSIKWGNKWRGYNWFYA